MLYRLIPTQGDPRPPPPPPTWPPKAHVTTAAEPVISGWMLDSGASHHVIADLENLSLHTPYDGTDDIVIRDGTGLHISHTGFTSLPSPSRSFHLQNVLCVPNMTRNLISIAKFCSTNHASIEFFSSHFSVKDLQTKEVLLIGRCNDGVYEWPASPTPKSVSIGVKMSSNAWHHHLGHPTPSIQNHVLSSFHLDRPLVTTTSTHCNDCLSNKSHKLPFSTSSIISTSPLQVIFSDVWTSPLHSIDGFKYYVIFVDHFSHYVWLYPLKRKSDVSATFTKFKP